MNTKPMKFKVPLAPRRAHQALFDRHLPFGARREQPKTQYQRRPKHPVREFE